MIPGPTAVLSLSRRLGRSVPALVLTWIALPVLAAPIPGDEVILTPVSAQQAGITRQAGLPSIVFAKKNGKSGGGGSGNSGAFEDDKDK